MGMCFVCAEFVFNHFRRLKKTDNDGCCFNIPYLSSRVWWHQVSKTYSGPIFSVWFVHFDPDLWRRVTIWSFSSTVLLC